MYTEQQILIIDGSLPDLNKYIAQINKSRWHGNTMKQDADKVVELLAKKQKLSPIGKPCYIEYHWYCKDKRIDKSNTAFAVKFIEDGLQDAGILLQDNWKAIDGFSHDFYVDKKKPRIEVIINY